MAGANDYIIPFGVNSADFLQGMAAMEQGIDNLGQASKDANAAMQQGMNNSTAAADKLSQSIAADVRTTAQLRDEAKQLGQSLGQALNQGASSDVVEKKLQKFNELIAQVQARAKTGIKLEADASKMAAFQAAIEAGASELEILNQVVSYTKERLAALDPGSEEFAELSAQLETAEGFMEGLGITTGATDERTKSLKAQLREMKAALADMELAGQGNTAEFAALSQQAGELEDQIGDVSQRVRVLASDTKYIDAGVQALQGLAGGFAAAQGAAALFGSENEDVQKVIQKVTGAMAVLQGIQALATALNKDSALSVLFLSRAQQTQAVTTATLAATTTTEAAATVGATTATNGFTAALLANPITAVLVAITAIVGILIAFASSSDDAKDATKSLNDELERQNQLLDLDGKALNRRIALMAAQAKAAGKSESEITKITGQGIADRRNLTQRSLDEFIKTTYNNNALRSKADAETNHKIEEQYLEYTETLKDLDNELSIARLDYSSQQKKEGIEAAKKAKENAKAATEAAKKDAEEQKKILDQKAKFLKETNDAETAIMKNQYDKERTALNNAASEKITALENEKALSEENAQARADAIVAINNALYAAIDEVDKKEATQRAQLEFKTRQTLIEIQAESAQKELDQLATDYEAKRQEINEAFKDEEDMRVKLIAAINKAEIGATKLAKDRLAREALDKEAERAELEVETAAKFVGKIPYIEEQKQIAILTVKLKYATLAKQQLLDQGNAESSTAVLNAQKQINDVTKALDDATKDLNKKSGKGIFNLQEILFGDQGPEGNEGIKKALNAAYEGIQQITDFIVDQYQRQIDKKQEVIDGYNDSIDELEDQLDKEKDLRDEGFANNVDGVQKEIENKKKLRDEEIKQQQEIQKKQENIQRAQMIVDTAVQASNLITAATEIFSALAGIPFVGVALAIGAIGVMIGGFIAAKAQAFSAVGSNKFGEGGTIDGPSHAAGGQKYRSIDGRGGVIELEGGEKVTNKRQSQKFGDILDGINENDFSGISDDALRNFLSEFGITLESDKQKDVVETVREREQLRNIFISQGTEPSEELMAIADDVAFLANSKRNSRDRWEDDKYIYERFGNKTTKRQK